MDRLYTVYKHTSPDGKVYIGATCSRDLRIRWQYGHGYKHNKPFWCAIQRFGWANFTHDILEEGLTAEEAKQREVYFIDKYQSCDPDKGYNRNRVSILPTASLTQEQEYARVRKIMDWHYKESSRRLKEKPPRPPKKRVHGPGAYHPMSPEKLLKISTAVVCLDTGAIYQSIKEASRIKGIDPGNISATCRGKRKQAGGLRWAYKTEEEG